MASSSDTWIREFNEASKLAEDIGTMISERSSLPASGPDIQRHLTAIRRKITILRTRLESLESILLTLPSMQPMYVTFFDFDTEQDEDLEKLEETVISTKHIALTVNEELDLHTGLIFCCFHIQRVQKRLAILNKRTKGGCSCQCLLLSVVAIVVLAVVVWALIKYL
ncbi:hypothetical protein BHE74_00031992 [Ensete ventricosum]|uniref:Uncharacterized protein n=1 Tax=Ensete ventricosum TaxID=4639 RepID=A0A444DAL9_ENSVE|nr:hypothetical protein B296_00031196 [Ensete ventricosum]RWV95168.1 hypothetical protein GW17_00042229 [Ensete ventricosum]RWW60980.1 hypothetical protein BHE74_00031992 [Ensete ventricosum]